MSSKARSDAQRTSNSGTIATDTKDLHDMPSSPARAIAPSPASSSAVIPFPSTSTAPALPAQDGIQARDISTISSEISVDALSPDIRDIISTLVQEYLSIGDEINDLEKSRKEIKAEIEKLLLPLRQKKVIGDSWYTNRQQRNVGKVDKNKLVALGVDLEIIEAATEEKKGKMYIEISWSKSEKNRATNGTPETP